MTQEVRYERNPDYVYRAIAGEMVLVPVRRDVADMDCIYTMNPVGAFVWERLDGQVTLAELRKAILDEFESDRETVAADLLHFVQQLEAAGAIRRL